MSSSSHSVFLPSYLFTFFLLSTILLSPILLSSFFRYNPVDVTAHAAFLPAQCDDLYTGQGHVKCDAGAWDLYNSSCTIYLISCVQRKTGTETAEGEDMVKRQRIE